MKKYLNKLVSTGFFHIFSSQVVNKIISLCSGIFIVRLLSKNEYGIYSYANNIISIFLLLDGLGSISGLLQFGSESNREPYKRRGYSLYTLKVGLLANAVISIALVVYALLPGVHIKGGAMALGAMALVPIFNYIYSYIQIGFRIRLQNKIYSKMTTIQSALMLVSLVSGAYFFGLYGAVYFKYIALIISIGIGLLFAKVNNQQQTSRYKLTKDEKKNFLNLSLISCICNGLSGMLVLLGVFITGLVVSNSNIIASYKTASTIPLAMSFIPMAIVTYIYPYFAMNNNNKQWIKRNFSLMIKYLLIFNLLLSIIMYIFAPFVILLIFGRQYLDSVTSFRILIISYFVSATFNVPVGNILVTLRKVKFNLFNDIVVGVISILLNIIFITKLGSVGAAYATLIAYIVSSILSMSYFIYILNREKPLIEENLNKTSPLIS